MSFVMNLDRGKVSKFIEKNWLMFLVVIGILLLLWCDGGASGAATQVMPVNSDAAKEGVDWWFHSIPLN